MATTTARNRMAGLSVDNLSSLTPATTKDAGGKKKKVTITPPKFGVAKFHIRGISPLVIHRFSTKLAGEIEDKMEKGKAAGSKKNREPKDFQAAYEEARYRSKEGWDGFNAASIRNAMVSACRLVSATMTLAKLSIFVVEDGRDAAEPQIPLIKILNAKPVMQKDVGRTSNNQPYITVRPAYHGWEAVITIRWDEDQFTLEDIAQLLSRVGLQVGIGEGRPDSKDSCGMGWGMFEVVPQRG